MAILDRFRSHPAIKSPDVDVRLAYIAAVSIDERDEIAEVAREDESPRVRRAAVGKLLAPAILALVAKDDADAGVRAQATAMLRDIALESFEETVESDSLAAVDALTDLKIVAQIAKSSMRESVARQALSRLGDTRALGSVARHAALEPVRLEAFASLHDHAEILAVALNSEFKDTAIASVERLTARADLEHVARQSSNRSAVKRARTILREQDERAAADAATAESAADEDRLAQAGELEAARVAAEHARADEARREVEAETRARDERQAAERASAEASREQAREEARVQARKDAERRRARCLDLVVEIETAAADADLRSAKRRGGVAGRDWRELTASAPADDDLAERFAVAEGRVTARDTQAKDADRRSRRDALGRMHQLLARVEPLAASSDLSARVAERVLRDARTALGAVPPLPSKADYDDVARRLKAAIAALGPKLSELREIEGWQRWANVGIQEQLCEKMEALKQEPNPDEIGKRVRELQQQWRQAADVPRAQGEALWKRFKAAHDEAWARCEAHFAADAGRRAENLARKIALCERVEALAGSTTWIQTAEEIKALQTEWKNLGPVSRGQEKATWERFRVACDRFFKRRHEDLAQRKVVWVANFAKKEALCVQAEALADSTDWEPAAAEIKRLQTEWKTIGPVKKSRSEAIWQRFRGACDRFFARYAARHEIARGERVAARETLCAELEALGAPPEQAEAAAASALDAAAADAAAAGQAGSPTSAAPPDDLLARVRSLRGKWQHEAALGGVEPARAAALDERFAAAFAGAIARWPQAFAGSDLDPNANRQRMEALVARVEKLAASLAGPAGTTDETLSPTTRLAAMLKEALASNTIGGKVDEESRTRAAQEEARHAQAAWSRIGSVPDAVRRPLADRFQRALRRISEAGRPGESSRPGGPGRWDRPATRPTRPIS